MRGQMLLSSSCLKFLFIFININHTGTMFIIVLCAIMFIIVYVVISHEVLLTHLWTWRQMFTLAIFKDYFSIHVGPW